MFSGHGGFNLNVRAAQMLSDILYICSTILLVSLYVPQLWKTWSTGEVKSFSIPTILMRLVANALICAYGAIERLPMLLVSSSVVVLGEFILLLMCVVGTNLIFKQSAPSHVQSNGKRGEQVCVQPPRGDLHD